MKKQQPKKQVKTSSEPEVVCPYLDPSTKKCSHPGCIRLTGMECKHFRERE